MPERIQRKRQAGWRKPENAVYVGRGSKWGNPFVVGEPSGIFDGKDGRCLGMRDQPEILIPSLTLEQVMEFYRNAIEGYIKPEMYPAGHTFQITCSSHRANLHELRGKNLMCWCALDKPCHADILLEIANA